MKNILKWFCKHDYEKIGWYEQQEYGIRYPIRIYKCTKCGKVIYVDGRKDRYAK